MTTWESLQLLISDFILAFAVGLIIEYLYVKWAGGANLLRLKTNNFMLLVLVATFVIILLRFIAAANIAPPISLALKLLGVLSILRFKAYTALPEDQSFLFLSIAMGVAIGLSEVQIILPIFVLVLLAVIFRHHIFEWWRRRRLPPPPKDLVALTIVTPALREKDIADINALIENHCPSFSLRWYNEQESLTAHYMVFYDKWSQISGLQKALRQRDATMQIALDF